jgi:DNA-binding transcriptional MerR regulator
MAGEQSYTLTEIARRLDVPQHRLIHLCEKGVVVPEVHDAAGRGSSRVFSQLNVLELAVALRLRDMYMPVSEIRGIVHVLQKFGETIQGRRRDFSLTQHLREPGAPDLRVVVSDGRAVYLTLGQPGSTSKVFGGIPLDRLTEPVGNEPIEKVKPDRVGDPASFGGPEGSHFARLELSVNAVAQALPID